MGFRNKAAVFVGVIAFLVGLQYFSYPPDIVQPKYKVLALDLVTKFSFNIVENIVHFIGIDKGDPIIWRQTQQENTRKVAENNEPGFEIKWVKFGNVRVLSYLPANKESSGKLPAVVFFHGGGWLFFNPDFYDKSMTRPLVRQLGNGTAFFSVEYRKAPTHSYPAALDDCVTAVKYLVDHSAEYNVDPKRVAVMGDSAGGNLAAAVALKLKKSGSKWMPKLQVLIYPLLQAFDYHSPSMHWPYNLVLDRHQTVRFTLAYIGEPKESYLSSSTIASIIANNHTSMMNKKKYKYLFAHQYLSEQFKAPENYQAYMNGYEDVKLAKRLEKKILDPLAFPLMASESDLDGLPEAYIITCQYDILRDHGVLYAERLREANVNVVHRNMNGAYHGILSFIGNLEMPSATFEINLLIKYLRNNL